MPSELPKSNVSAPDQNIAHPHPQPTTGISVLIIGAGVGGIMSALECWRKGHTVRIVEQRHWLWGVLRAFRGNQITEI